MKGATKYVSAELRKKTVRFLLKLFYSIFQIFRFLTQNKGLFTFNFSTLSTSFQSVYLLHHFHLFSPSKLAIKSYYERFSNVISIHTGYTVLKIKI